ncbi:MAG: TadE/TadG family type IV pilus assembly protein [Gemmataceae bacterium]
MRLKPKKSITKRLGTACVEMAVILPVLAAMGIGMIELSRLVQVKHILTNCAREVTRRAILSNATDTGVKANLSSILTAANITPSNVTTTIKVNGVTADISTAKAGDTISVTLSVPSSTVTWVTPMFTSSTVTSEALTMMKQNQ